MRNKIFLNIKTSDVNTYIHKYINNTSVMSVLCYRLIIQEAASRIWVNYAEGERKAVFMPTEKFPTQIQSVSFSENKIFRLDNNRYL